MNNIKYLVYTTDLENISFVKECNEAGICCTPVEDARSAVYVATGICAQNKEKVIVCVNASNASRSAFSGMTEAFYRKLPVALITFGNILDYTRELRDVVENHYIVSKVEEISPLLKSKFPLHIEVLGECIQYEKKECGFLQSLLCSILDENEYLYIAQGIEEIDGQYKCKIVRGGMPNCYEGALSNVLGASLTKKRRRYICLASEEEYVHDINTLGNININNSLFFIMVGKRKNETLISYAKSLSFEVKSVKEDSLTIDFLADLVNNKKRTVLMVYREN